MQSTRTEHSTLVQCACSNQATSTDRGNYRWWRSQPRWCGSLRLQQRRSAGGSAALPSAGAGRGYGGGHPRPVQRQRRLGPPSAATTLGGYRRWGGLAANSPLASRWRATSTEDSRSRLDSCFRPDQRATNVTTDAYDGVSLCENRSEPSDHRVARAFSLLGVCLRWLDRSTLFYTRVFVRCCEPDAHHVTTQQGEQGPDGRGKKATPLPFQPHPCGERQAVCPPPPPAAGPNTDAASPPASATDSHPSPPRASAAAVAATPLGPPKSQTPRPSAPPVPP